MFAINLGLLCISNANAILLECYTLFEFLLFASFLYVNFKSVFAKKLLLTFTTIFFIFFLFYTYVLKKDIVYIDSVPIGIETLFILPFCFYYLYEQISDVSTLYIYTKYTFWVVLGIALYLAGSFFIYLFTNFLTRKEVRDIWFVTNIFSVLKNVFFCIAIFINARPSKENEQYHLDLSRLY